MTTAPHHIDAPAEDGLPPIITVPQMMEFLQIGRYKADRLVECLVASTDTHGDRIAFKTGREYRIRASGLREWMNNGGDL